MYDKDDVRAFKTPEAQEAARAAYLQVEEKLAAAKATLAEAAAIADKAGISFNFSYDEMGLAYGMGGRYYPKNENAPEDEQGYAQYGDGEKGGWKSSSDC